jgi:DNA polymerase III subunit gamma/tau
LAPIFSEPQEPAVDRKEIPKAPVEAPKPALKKLTRQMSGPSIKSVMNGGTVSDDKVTAKEQHELYTNQVLSESFTDEQLQLKWKQYVATLEDRPNLKSTLSREPILNDDGTLLLKIDNHVQDDLIKSIKPQLVSWLRRELKNSAIELVTELNETQVQRFAYTDGEKFEEMLQKNPDLAYMKQRFNLDFEG